MIHTINIETQITFTEYANLMQNQDIKRIDDTGYLHTFTNQGITLNAYPFYLSKQYSVYYCKAVVNLEKLIQGQPTMQAHTITEDTKNQIEEKFKTCIASVLPYRTNIDNWKLTRIDFAIDIKTPFVKEYIKLLQRGDRPRQTTIDNNTQHKSSLTKTHYANSVRYTNGSITLNIYDKQEERKIKGYPQEILKEAKNTLRVELQCKERKLLSLKKTKNISKINLSSFLFKENEVKTLILKYIKQIAGTDDYYNYNLFVAKIKISELKGSKEKLFEVAREINTNKSVWKARAKGKIKNFATYKSLFYKIGLNPVYIPRDWGIEKLPSLFTLINAIN